MGPQAVSLVGMSIIHCPYLKGSTIGGMHNDVFSLLKTYTLHSIQSPIMTRLLLWPPTYSEEELDNLAWVAQQSCTIIRKEPGVNAIPVCTVVTIVYKLMSLELIACIILCTLIMSIKRLRKRSEEKKIIIIILE